MAKTFDFTIWREPLKRRDFKFFYFDNQIPFWRHYGLALFAAFIFAPLVIASVEIFLIPTFLPDAPKFLHLWAVAALVSVIIPTFFWAKNFRREIRLAKFCRANDLVYHQKISNFRLPGTPFLNNHHSLTAPLISGVFATDPSGNFEKFILGRYIINEKRENNLEIRMPFTFAKSSLPRAVPHIILKNRHSRIIPLIGSGANAKLKLEGDYSDQFSLICPTNYERDALYIFTPDVIAAIYDFAADTELELIDDNLFLYTRKVDAFHDPVKLANLFDLLARLNSRFDKNTKNYHDASADKNSGANVAKSAQRLHLLNWSWLTILWSVLILAIIAVNLMNAFRIGPFHDWFTWLSRAYEKFLGN